MALLIPQYKQPYVLSFPQLRPTYCWLVGNLSGRRQNTAEGLRTSRNDKKG